MSENIMGADLHDVPHAEAENGPGGRLEIHALADVAPPVVGIQLIALADAAFQGGHEYGLALGGLDVFQAL